MVWTWIPLGIAVVWVLGSVGFVVKGRYFNLKMLAVFYTLIGVGGVASGVYLGTVRARAHLNDIAAYDQLPGGYDITDADTVPPGSQVIFTGTLRGNRPVDLSAYGLSDHQYVLYEVFVYDSEDEAWMHRETIIPESLTMVLDGGTIQLIAPQNPQQITGSLSLSRDVRLPAWIGSRPGQLRGLRNGDTITIVGTLQSDRRVLLEQLHVGNAASMTEAARRRALGGVFGSIILIIVTGMIGWVGVLAMSES